MKTTRLPNGYFSILLLLFILSPSFAADSVDGDCDVLVLQSGEEISAKVLKIGDTEIEYKKCDNLTGATFTIKSADVFMVKFANGTKERIR